MEDADEPVREGSEGLVMGGAAGAPSVIERAGAGELLSAAKACRNSASGQFDRQRHPASCRRLGRAYNASARNLRAERLVFELAAAAYDHGGRLVDLVPHARQVRERLGRDQPVAGRRRREPHLLLGI